jgi:SAM-dependent methyltransferase
MNGEHMAEKWNASVNGATDVNGATARASSDGKGEAVGDGEGGAATNGGSGADVKANVMRMYQFIYGNWFTMVTCVYAELDIARLLRESPRTIEQLAGATRTNPKALERFLRCAGALGFHTADAATGRLTLTDFGFLLCAESPVSLRAAARLNGATYRYQPWGHLLEYVRTGTGRGLSPTWEHGSLEYLKDKPDLLEVFEEAMTDLSKTAYRNVNENRVIAESVDFKRFRRVLDIGCGNGTLIEEIVRANRNVRGALFDLATVLKKVSLPAAGHPNAGRVEMSPGDYCQSVPAGYDAYIMKNVMHNLPEHKCKTLLDNTRQAILDGSPDEGGAADKRLIMFELLMPDEGEGNMTTKLINLNMNLLLDGSNRTTEDYEALLNERGFELLSVSELPGLERKAIEASVML